MRRTEALQGVRIIKFLSILSRYEASEYSQLEVAELLGVGDHCFLSFLAADFVYKAPLRSIRQNPAGRHPGRAARMARLHSIF